ncbi:major facilitator superfamily domain-containing protein [Nemania sp. NC0429]|nr:major facilitator superfamily domain-containing protein [Nemania sp. NC0429]
MARSEDEEKEEKNKNNNKEAWWRIRARSGFGIGVRIGRVIRSSASRLVCLLAWLPPWLRPRDGGDADFELTWGLTLIYATAGALSVANLYYTTPILNILADEFGVSDERAALIPSVTQAGYAGGLLFIIPLGDILRRRYLILGLVFSTAFVWLGCILAPTFPCFLALSFLVGLLTVTPQLMFPLAAQYAPPRLKTTLTSVIVSGLVLGILVARLLSGVATQYAPSWRTVYWLSLALQGVVLALLYLFMRDYPVAGPGTSYGWLLRRVAALPLREPLLTQHALVAFLAMGMFTSFWTTLTFQLVGVFGLPTLGVGLFALAGAAPALLNPLVSRLLVSRVHPHATLLVALPLTLAVVVTGTFVGASLSLAGPIIWALLGDLGLNTAIVANRAAIATVDPTAHNAVNSVYMIFTFAGQLFGTAVGNALYARGGWLWSGALNIAQLVVALLLVIARGPHEKGWVGWTGGWDLMKVEVVAAGAGDGTTTGIGTGTGDGDVSGVETGDGVESRLERGSGSEKGRAEERERV